MKDNTSEALLTIPVFDESFTWKTQEREMEDNQQDEYSLSVVPMLDYPMLISGWI